MPKKVEWTKEEDEFLIENYHKMTLRELSAHLNKPTPTVDRRAKDVLHLGSKARIDAITDEEKKFVKSNWETMTITELAKELGVSRNRVNSISEILKKEGVIKLKYRRSEIVRLKLIPAKLKDIKDFILEIENFNEADMYDIADEVEEILEVIKERLQEGIE